VESRNRRGFNAFGKSVSQLEWSMRYFFDVKNGHRLIDPSGLDCRDDREAINAGEVIAKQIAEDAPPTQVRHVEVLDADRQIVGQVSIKMKNSR
jgi:hypothetical protein